MQILLLMYKSETKHWGFIQLWHKIGCSQKVFYEAISLLEELKLVERACPPNEIREHLHLTDKGKATAEHLHKFLESALT